MVDLTPVFCGPRTCLPVIGGVLVHKDAHHLTRTFSRTLGPLLDEALGRSTHLPGQKPSNRRGA